MWIGRKSTVRWSKLEMELLRRKKKKLKKIQKRNRIPINVYIRSSERPHKYKCRKRWQRDHCAPGQPDLASHCHHEPPHLLYSPYSALISPLLSSGSVHKPPLRHTCPCIVITCLRGALHLVTVGFLRVSDCTLLVL